ncbi:MAG: VTT domain-containing protein [Solirubrobacteraceae bacterium MAG38_C4-C5]|nr:VTT domain-containing protein [Candidatus Siliceabacter maunaloa]
MLTRPRPGPRTRLALLVATLVGLGALFTFGGVISTQDVRTSIDPAGPLAPLAYVVAGALLGAALVPGWLLAGASGLLFGPVLGTAVTICSAVGTALLARGIARRAGREGAAALAPARHAAVEAWTARHGLLAVIVARLAPAVPDAPMSYAAGLAGITAVQIGLGTLIASTPRAFAYTALGGSLDDLTSPLALIAFALLGVTMLSGALLARAHVRRSRTAARAMGEPADGPQ